MRPREVAGDASSTLARRALIVASSLAFAGASVGVFAILRGLIYGIEVPLIISSAVVSAAVVIALLCRCDIPLQTVATVTTVYFLLYLCAGTIAGAFTSVNHSEVFTYLLWFFLLRIYNELVNSPLVGRRLGFCISVAPVVTIIVLTPQLVTIFPLHLRFIFLTYCISYVAFCLMLKSITRYRERYASELQRAQSLKVESDILESISDCFISLDSEMRLVYVNDAACSELRITRTAALRATLDVAAPGFFPASLPSRLAGSTTGAASTVLESHHEAFDTWYELRCFPRADGLSIYFRNITESVIARRRLAEANAVLREQAELLDKAQDAIFVHNLNLRITYWNKGAQRLYGWTAGEAVGRRIDDILQDDPKAIERSISAIIEAGEWSGELTQQGRNGKPIVVESRCTLVRGPDDHPESILAINTDITNRKAAEAKIEHLAFYDTLTELPNRLLLRERLHAALVSATRRQTKCALLFIDLDDFKTLNDTLGHTVGDAFLQHIAQRLKTCGRANDTVARLGGDEFVVLAEDLSGDAKLAAADAKLIGDKILAALSTPFVMGAYERSTTASIGITLFLRPSDTVDDLLKRADLAMYRAKAAGRNRVCFFDPAMEVYVASRAALESDLRRAMENREFKLYYQPQVDRLGYITGAEALLRWYHCTRGPVSPEAFIPLAEEAGLIIELGRFVLETACAELARWALRPETAALTIAVNVSLRQFLDPNLVRLVLDVLSASGVDPTRLKLEITESSSMENVADTIAKMTALKAHGVGFSLDDFGTGYSSLSHLKRLPLDQLKIDRSFVADVLTDVKDASIARTLITLGKSLGISLIAEGVETEGQRNFLEAEGCHIYQGYLFSPAVSAEVFDALVTTAPLVGRREASSVSPVPF